MNILKIISQMQEEKQKQNKSPSHVSIPELEIEVQKQLKYELNILATEGKIGVVNTVNSKAVYVK